MLAKSFISFDVVPVGVVTAFLKVLGEDQLVFYVLKLLRIKRFRYLIQLSG